MAEIEQTDVKTEQAEDSSATAEVTNTEGQTSEQITATEQEKTPDPAIAALERRIQELSREKAELRDFAGKLMAQGGKDVEPDEDAFGVDEEGNKPTKVQKALYNRIAQYENSLGTVMENMDLMAITQSPSLAPLYREHHDEIEAFRREKAQMGYYMKREEALAMVLHKKGILVKQEQAQPKKTVNKQAIKPAGETRQATNRTAEAGKPKDLKERLKDIKF